MFDLSLSLYDLIQPQIWLCLANEKHVILTYY